MQRATPTPVAPPFGSNLALAAAEQANSRFLLRLAQAVVFGCNWQMVRGRFVDLSRGISGRADASAAAKDGLAFSRV